MTILLFDGHCNFCNAWVKLIVNRDTAKNIMFAHLDGWERHFQLLVAVPRPLRDAVYHFIAKYRYKWFGMSEQCMIPTTELKERFLAD